MQAINITIAARYPYAAGMTAGRVRTATMKMMTLTMAVAISYAATFMSIVMQSGG